VTDPITQTGVDGTPYLAVDVQPDVVAGYFTLDVSRLDGPDVLLLHPEGTWLNVVCTVLEVEYQRGAARLAGLLNTTEAGTATVVLEDTDGSFDPMTGGELIHKGSPIRFRAWSTDDGTGDPWDAVLFTGAVDRLAVEYRRDEPALVTITALDVIGELARWESEGYTEPGVGTGDDLAERLDRIVDETGVGALSPDSDTVFTATLAPTVLARPWQELQSAVEAELGRLWVDRDNQWVVRARGAELTGTVRGTLSDVHGEALTGVHCCIGAARPGYGPENLTNRAIGARRLPSGDVGPAVLARRDDAFSQERYGVGAVDRRSLELSTDVQVAAWCEAVVTGNTTPELRLDQVVPLPAPDDLDSALLAWPAVCATDVGDRWLFRTHTYGGRLVEQTFGVLGITATLTPESWDFTWTTALAPDTGFTIGGGWFVAGVSVLDGNDLLAPFSVPVT